MMKQQIRFFELLTRLKIFRDVPIIILLNKTDVLGDLMCRKPISEHFQEYTGPTSCWEVCQFFADKFAKSDQRAAGDLRIYRTCAVERTLFQGTIQCLRGHPDKYKEMDSSNRMGGEASAHNSVGNMLFR